MLFTNGFGTVVFGDYPLHVCWNFYNRQVVRVTFFNGTDKVFTRPYVAPSRIRTIPKNVLISNATVTIFFTGESQFFGYGTPQFAHEPNGFIFDAESLPIHAIYD